MPLIYTSLSETRRRREGRDFEILQVTRAAGGAIKSLKEDGDADGDGETGRRGGRLPEDACLTAVWTVIGEEEKLSLSRLRL